MFIAAEGTIVSHKNNELIYQSITKAGYTTPIQQSLQGNDFVTFDEFGKKSYIFSEQSPSLEWTVGTVVTEKEFDAASNHIAISLAFLNSIAIVFILIFVSSIIWTIAKSLKELKQVQQEVAQSNLEATKDIYDNDEFVIQADPTWEFTLRYIH